MIYAGLLLTCAIGWLLLPSRLHAPGISKWGVAFGAGAAAISVQMFAYDLAGLGWNAYLLLLPWLAAGGYYLYRNRESQSLPEPHPPRWWQIAVFAGLLIPLGVWLPFERVMPLTSQSWDAWAIWLFKAKAFYLDGTIDEYLVRSSEFANHPGYPLLVPLYATFLYVLNGGVDDQAVKVMSPGFFVAMLGVFYVFARRFGTRWAALAFTVMTAALHMVNVTAFGWAGYADTTLSLYILACGGFLYAWHRDEKLGDLAGASVAATAAAWTKNEGQFFLAAVIILAGIPLVRKRPSLQALGWLLGPPAVVLGAWFAVRQAYGIEASEFTPGAAFQLELFFLSAWTLLTKAADVSDFNLAFYLLAGSAAAAAYRRPGRAFWMIPGLVAWHVFGALLAYATGRNEIHWWLETSGDRILAQVAPLAMLAPALLFSQWMEEEAQHAEGARESETRKKPRPATKNAPKKRRAQHR